MKKIILTMLALVFTFAVTSCRDTEKKTEDTMDEAIEAVEEAAEDAEEAIEEAAENLEEAMEEADDDVQESAAKAQLKSE